MIPKANQRIRQYLNFLDRQRYTRIADITFEVLETTQTHRTPPDEADEGDWLPITLPYAYGKEWTSYWFRTHFLLPESAAGKEIFLRGTPNADSLVFLDGKPYGALNPPHEVLRLASCGKAGHHYRLHIESYAGHRYPGAHPLMDSSIFLTLGVEIKDYPNIFHDAGIFIRNPRIDSLYYDVLTLINLVEQLDLNSLRRNSILYDLYEGLMKIRFTASGPELEDQIAEAASAIAPLLRVQNGPTTPQVFLVGHAHIDHAWLWPIRETERKAARTFINMIRLAEEFPEFIFMQTQPAQLDIVRREYPQIFKEVRKAYNRGQWEPNGGMWVEADCNLTGGESFIRQFMLGKQATLEMLGYEGDTLWLPDVFGYSAALPQILEGCEIEYFVTSKINWNDTTRFPYDTFTWCGIDGTGIKTHYITSRMNGYNGRVGVADLFDAWNHVQNKEVQSAVVKPIGEGDGGGGTLRADLELARRLANTEGAPRVQWTPVSRALADIFNSARNLPEWRGELYLELHRGTSTTQARIKRYNRKLEFALREVEFLYSILANLGADTQGIYPWDELYACWKKVLTNQFHDILPGSSINQVYRDAEKWYQEVEESTQRLIARGADILSTAISAAGLEALESSPPRAARRFIAVNSLSWQRKARIVIPWKGDRKQALVMTNSACTVPIQLGVSLDGKREGIALAPLPSMGASIFMVVPDDHGWNSAFSLNGKQLETPLYHIDFDDGGRILHLIDLEIDRDFVAPGQALNTFQSAEDLPVLWDAWDIDSDWTKSLVDEDRLESSEIVSQGPVFFQIRNRYRICRVSSLVQDIIFYASDRRIDFITKVEWHESHRLLKVAFPVSVTANQVRCEIQYGHVIRTNHQNLPQDQAQFEFCAHKWISLEESGCGIALLNDCKYGHDLKGSVMRLTLLRSPKAPDPHADMGTHHFTYSLLPFAGPFTSSTVVQAAYNLNRPATICEPSQSPPERIAEHIAKDHSISFFTIDNPNVIIETVKMAEPVSSSPDPTNSSKLDREIVLRLYETSGGTQKAALSTFFKIDALWEINMLERKPRPRPYDSNLNRASLEFRPFEIKTLKLRLSSTA